MKRPLPLSCRRDFRRVTSSGERRRTRCGILSMAATTDAEGRARLGLAVPGTVGGAVVRNRIKRRLRAAYRSAGPARGVDVVFRANQLAERAPFQELEDIVRGMSPQQVRS